MESIAIEVGDLLESDGGSLTNFVNPSSKNWKYTVEQIVSLPRDTTALAIVDWGASDSTSSVDDLYKPPASSLLPGESISVLFQSRSLPSMKRFWGQGWVRPISQRDIDSLHLLGSKDNEIFRPWYEEQVQGITITPNRPPSPFIHMTFLDTILSYTRQSAERGWLGRGRDDDCDNDEKPEEGIVRNIEQRLGKAKKLLERRDSVLARRELEKLVDKVERLWKRSQDVDKKDKRNRWEKKDKVVMTSEAYALLKYNLEYMIDRLPDRKPKKGSKDKD